MVDIILLTWNNPGYTIKCLRSIKEHTRYPYRLIWVDNGSDPNPKKRVLDWLCFLQIPHKSILLDKNCGFPKGVNEGIKISTSDHIVLLNNDTRVTEGWLGKLVGYLEEHQELGVVGAVSDGIANIQNWIKCSKFLEVQPKEPAEEFINNLPHRCLIGQYYVSYFCVAAKRSVIDEIGLLDEEFGIGYHEDTDYDNRLFHAGYKTGVATNCFVYHAHRVSAKSVPNYQDLIRKNWGLVERKKRERESHST